MLDSSDLTVIKELSLGGSGGNLPKWIFDCDGTKMWGKGRLRADSFEPEAEVCAYRLACLFGLPAIEYELLEFKEDTICVSKDYSCGLRVMSLYQYVIGMTGKEPSEFFGRDKLELVESVLSENAKLMHRAILLFDYIVGNKDRHLRNFEVRLNKGGTFESMVEMFDTGTSLFSDESVGAIKFACCQEDNYVHSKPYGDPHCKQLKLVREYVYLLRAVKRQDLYRIINSCFSGLRAKYLGLFVKNNVERLGLLC